MNLKLLKNEAKIENGKAYIPVELIEGNTRDIIPFFCGAYNSELPGSSSGSLFRRIEVLGLKIYITIDKDVHLEKVIAEIEAQKEIAEKLMSEALEEWEEQKKRIAKEARELQEQIKKEQDLLEYIKGLDI